MEETYIVTIKAKVRVNVENEDETQEIKDKLEKSLVLHSDYFEDVSLIDYDIKDFT
ncbi:hypothetical protein TwortDSMZ_052 [Staphylococcus phage Twort]|uniref:Uncharacterized protein n=2 Tax=Staphylococcus phage Twort (strain DSM 17442 / HER 48) TaxID=2908167 RepID=A0A6H0X5E2_BPTWO|nr:ORF236 [Staphylococcus phage Twort]AAX92473.1 ORF236 [Staphylococcus phage Twort]QIW89057.1 hypothetical protein TwortDSMZ_052 [Staphylococcus phage Twort]